jgi:hypothetical protein
VIQALEEIFDKMDSPNEQDAIAAMLDARAKLGSFSTFAQRIESSPLLLRGAICDAIKSIDAYTSEESINAFFSARKLLTSDQLTWRRIARALEYFENLTDKLDQLEQSIRDNDKEWEISTLQGAQAKLERDLDSLRWDHDALKSDHERLKRDHDSIRDDHDSLEQDQYQLERRITRLAPAESEKRKRSSFRWFVLIALLVFIVIAFKLIGR